MFIFIRWIFVTLSLAVMAANSVNSADRKSSKTSYSIVGSQFIRPNSKYFVAINVHDGEEPVGIRVSIRDGASDEAAYLQSQNVTLYPLSSTTIEFEMGQLSSVHSHQYHLMAEGLSGLEFRQDATLWLHQKTASIHVQTDRPEYVVGDSIRFRVFVTDIDTRPITVDKQLNVFLKNSSDDIVQTWINESTFQGWFSSETIIDGSSVGKWTIMVEYLENSQVTAFNVIQLIPYNIQLMIETAESIVYNDKLVRAKVTARKHGQPVKGEVSIRLASLFVGLHDGVELTQSKILEPNGELMAEFKLDQLRFDDLYYRELDLVVQVKDAETGLTTNSSVRIHLQTNPYYLRNIDEKQLLPGLPFTSVIQVFRHDNQRIKDLSRPLTLTYSAQDNFEESISKVYRLDERGEIAWNITVPNNYSELYVKAEYEGLEEIIGVLVAAESPVSAFLQLNVLQKEIHITQEFEIEVLSTENLSWLTYQLIGRYGCFYAETVKIPDEKRFVIRLQPDAMMFPDVQLIVYYFKDMELVSTSVDLSFRDDFRNSIHLKTFASRIPAGGELELTVQTTPGSLVTLMAIDQSHNVRSAKAIDADYIAYDLSQYNELYYRPGYIGQRIQHWLSDNDETVFSQSNTVVLSNVIPPFSREPVFEDDDNSFHYQPDENWLRNSYDLSQSWLFSSINISSSSEVHRFQVPANQKTWAISAISLHPETGLGLSHNDVKIKVV